MNDYVVATFVVVWFVMLMYVAAVAMRTAKMAREAELLARLVRRDQAATPGTVGSSPTERG